jgi:cell division protease FtsH
MLDEICALLGGRAAEELFLHRTSTGALNDLERVTKQAYSIIVYYGMSDSLANISYFDSSGQSEYSFSKPYSEKTAEAIDLEVKNLVSEQYERAKHLLSEHNEGHRALANILVEREVIFSEDVEHIFGKRQWTSRSEEIIEAQKKQEAQNALEAAAKESENPIEKAENELPETNESSTESKKSQTEKNVN